MGKWFPRGGAGMSKHVVVGKLGACLVPVGEMGIARWVQLGVEGATVEKWISTRFWSP